MTKKEKKERAKQQKKAKKERKKEQKQYRKMIKKKLTSADELIWTHSITALPPDQLESKYLTDWTKHTLEIVGM